MFNARVVRVLIASPSDVQGEREAIEQAIHEWNALNGEPMGVVLLPVRWETHSRPGLGDRPQALINKQLVDDCDMLVGCFWTRLGSPTGVADSGTLEEIDQLAERKAPVLLYFSDQPVIPSTIESSQFEALQEFKEGVRERGLTVDYSDVSELRHRLMSDLTREVRASFAPADGEGVEKVGSAAQATPSRAESLNAYRKILKQAATQIKARWAVYRDQFDQEDWRYTAEYLRDQLLELQVQLELFMDNDDAAILDDLKRLATDAQAMSAHRYYMDGGRSLRTFQAMMDALLANLDYLCRQDWSEYVVSSLPATASVDDE